MGLFCIGCANLEEKEESILTGTPTKYWCHSCGEWIARPKWKEACETYLPRRRG